MGPSLGMGDSTALSAVGPGQEQRGGLVTESDERAPRVFVSYSWDDPEHIAWVLRLATRLREDGVDVVLDRWDTRLGSDLSLFMEKAADTSYRVLIVASSNYAAKADAGEGGVGYERRVITPSLMKDLGGHRAVPVLRENQEGELPRFMGAAKYVDFRDENLYEDRYYELLQDLHGIHDTPKPLLGRNPFGAMPDEEVPIALRHDPARYVMPGLEGHISFDYSDNNGHFVIGAGDRAFTVAFSEAGTGSIYIYSDPPDINTVALAPGVTSPQGIGDASSYDGSSRARTIRVGDAAVLRNRDNYWAAVFVDEVETRDSSPSGHPMISFRFCIPPTPTPDFGPAATE
jgi:hypothetical protein